METILIPGAEIYYDRNFLPAEEATILFDILQTKCAWQRHRSSFKYAVPRDEAYYGDPGTSYTYSRREHKPLTWIPELFSLGTRVEGVTPAIAYSSLSLSRRGYNAVLCNLYRNGNDSVGLHADAEPGIGPVIASISLGSERLFRLKGKNGAVAFAERLPQGSLLIMAGNTQKNFKHEVPKEPAVALPQSNLTFRHIEHQLGQFMAAAGIAQANRELVVDESAATAGEGRRTLGETCPLLLAFSCGRTSDEANLCDYGAADRGSVASGGIAEGVAGKSTQSQEGAEGCVTRPDGKALVSSCGTRIRPDGTVSRVMGPAKEHNYALESLDRCIVSPYGGAKTEIPIAREAVRESARRAARARWARMSAKECSRTMKQVAAHRWNKKERKVA